MKSSGKLSPDTSIKKETKPNRTDGHPSPRLLCFMLVAFLIIGCSHGGESTPAGSILLNAIGFFNQENYEASLDQYEKFIEKEPAKADRALFELGIIYAHPANSNKNYQKALECYRKIVSDYPNSKYRRESQIMIFQIQNVILKDHLIAKQQTQIDDYRRSIASRENEAETLKKKVDTLERKVFELWKDPVDKVLIEKQSRRLTLISHGEAIKTYKIALGGNPVGPKEREGDNKTPEGIYTIESRNRNSEYHLSLRISYPNEKDIEHAKALGVSPGGNIMIHGIKNGFSPIGGLHAEMDWTKGCIAVTNEEMEEIARLVPTGTPVEIRP